MRVKCSVCGRFIPKEQQSQALRLVPKDKQDKIIWLCTDHSTEKTKSSGVTRKMSTKPAIAFSELFPKAQQETDRYELKPGLDITITGIVISEATKYGKLAKINGLVDDEPKKYYTTGKIVVRQCEDIINRLGGGSELRQPVSVHVAERISRDNRRYLELE